VCFHQGLAPRQCIGGDETDGAIEGHPDGRPCERVPSACLGPEAEPGYEYRCEHVGLFGTYSVDDRVRYRGELHDPNEVALTISAGALAILIGFALRKRSGAWKIAIGVAFAITLATVFMTESRGGLVAAMLVPGVYVVRRYGIAAIIPALAIAVPILLLGGRSDANAEMSTELRYEAWATGLQMFHHNPLFGVGARQFGEHHFLTAHNSYVLALAELGIVGLVLFVSVIYLSLKTLVVGMRALDDVPGARVAKVWGMTLLAAMAGIVFQINTLSFAYHSVLWLFFGLVGAWYSAVRHHAPEIVVKMSLRDVAIVVVASIAYAVVILPLFLRAKGFL
jgi:O-antigen ligase